MDQNVELRRIPFTVRLTHLSAHQQLGIFVTDSDEVINEQRQIYEPIFRGVPSISPPQYFGSSKQRHLYVMFDSPIFILAQSIAQSHLEVDSIRKRLSFPAPLSPDATILDVMIDQYEHFCLKSLDIHKNPTIPNGFHHTLLQSQLHILPSMVCRDLLKSAMVGLFHGGDIIDSIEYDVKMTCTSRSPSTKNCSSAATGNISHLSKMDFYRQKVRRQKTYFNGNRDEGALVNIFRDLLGNISKYPIDIKFVRMHSISRRPAYTLFSTPLPIISQVEGRVKSDSFEPESTIVEPTRYNHRPKRKKVQSLLPSSYSKSVKKRTTRSSSLSLNSNSTEPITILDSDDDDDEIEVNIIKPTSESTKVIDMDDIDQSFITITKDSSQEEPKLNFVDATPTIAETPYTILPDLTPKYASNNFVFIKSIKNPGYIISIRVVRDATSIMSILRSHIIYVVYVRFGIAYIREDDLQSLEESNSVEIQRKFTFDGVSVTTMDQLRLWPSLYLNDPLINFYMKYIQKKFPSQDIFIFPTYFYSRVSYFDEGGLVYRDNKEQRGKLWQDLKGWTKGIDIFTKSFIVFPINFNKHWSFVLLCNPGQFLRNPLKKPATTRMKTVGITVLDYEDEDNQKATSLLNDSKAESVLMDIPRNDESKTESILMDIPRLNELTHMDEVLEIDQSSEPLHKQSNQDICFEEDERECVNEDAVIEIKLQNNTIDISMSSGSSDDITSADSTLCLLHFDSGKRFKCHTASVVFKIIRKYFHACYEATKEEQYPGRVVDAKSVPGINPDLPQQCNAEDCGVYMLEFMERFLINPSSIDGNAVSIMAKNNGKVPANFWFTPEVAYQKREFMYDLIDTLAKGT